jgi:hypothetical protein
MAAFAEEDEDVKYLVKWRALSYAEATWEDWNDMRVDGWREVFQFWLRHKVPAQDQIASNTRPPIQQYRKARLCARANERTFAHDNLHPSHSPHLE